MDRDGAIVAYNWDFGDGSHASGPAVTHQYAKSGTYTVTLTIIDNSTTNTDTQSDTLSVRVNEPPVANAGPDQLVTASLVQFDGSASGDADDSISVYAWDFGDGQAGDGPTPTHVYAEPGTYDVTLVVTDASETIRNTAEDAMQVVVNARPIADAGPDLVAAPGETLTFQGTRSLDPDGAIAEYAWDFRDGATAYGEIARHAFDKPGIYAVQLSVKDDTGQDEAVDHAEASVFINAPPVAEAGADVAAAPGDEIRFSAAASFDSDGTIANYRWDFTDLDRADGRGGDYADLHRAGGLHGAAHRHRRQRRVERRRGRRAPHRHQPPAGRRCRPAHRDRRDDHHLRRHALARRRRRPADLCLGFRRRLDRDRRDRHPHLRHRRDLPGGARRSTTARGSRTPRRGPRLEVAINRAPVAVAGENQQVCTGDIVVLDGSKSSDAEGSVLRYAWDFGDGTGSEIVNPTKSYSKGATYPVTLTVRDDTGLGNGVSTDQIAVRVDQGPVASAGADILACAGTEVQFDGTGSTDIDGVVNSFTWDFGDGNTGGGETPSHIYERPGDYRAFLTIEGEKAGICSSTSTDEVEVRIIEGPVAVIAAPAAVPITDTVTFDGSASHMAEGKITAYEWDFGDGTTATGAKATHHYAEPGTYAVSLTLRSDSTSPTCQTVSARHLIRVNATPIASAGEDKHVAVGEETVFDASASRDADGGIVAYEWDFGDGTTATGIAGPPPLRGGRDLHREARRPRRGGPRQFVFGRRADGDGQPGAGAGDRWA